MDKHRTKPIRNTHSTKGKKETQETHAKVAWGGGGSRSVPSGRRDPAPRVPESGQPGPPGRDLHPTAGAGGAGRAIPRTTPRREEPEEKDSRVNLNPYFGCGARGRGKGEEKNRQHHTSKHT